jgi:hypothetical protein
LDYKPSPIDALRLTLTPEIAQLSEMLAKNAHENWANLRIAQGWHYILTWSHMSNFPN